MTTNTVLDTFLIFFFVSSFLNVKQEIHRGPQQFHRGNGFYTLSDG